MKVKIATWNMDYWHHVKQHHEAWDHFVNRIEADLYFFQEARPTDVLLEQRGHILWNEIGGKRNWGSGIYSQEYELLEEKIESQFEGVFSVGKTLIGTVPITLVSLYGLMESSGPTQGYSINNLHRMLSDLTGLFNGHIGGKRNLIMGGDFNASTQLDPLQNNNSHKILFDRIDDFGLKDVFRLSGNTSHVQTLRHARSAQPWQNDYFYISESLAGRFIKCDIIDDARTRLFSDHNVVTVDLDL